MIVLLGVMVAGAAGASARYLLDGAIQQRHDSEFPFGTFIINVTGSLALGLLAGFVLSRGSAPETLRIVLGTGFIGAYTTFSTWMLETVDLVKDGAWRLAVTNIVGTTLAGGAAAAVGLWLGGML